MSAEYRKNFDAWNKRKKYVEQGSREVFGYPREVWWYSLGLNIGAEIDGKNENFERPVIVMRVYNKETMLVLPTTSRAHLDKFHLPIQVDGYNIETREKYQRTVYVKLTQARVISNRRLLRKVDVITEADFLKIQAAFRAFV